MAQHVFLNSFIPRRLDEVTHFERDAARLASGSNTEGIYYQTVTGLEADLSGVRTVPSVLRSEEPAEEAQAAVTAEQSEDDSSSSGDEDEDEDEEGSGDAPSTWADRPDAPGREEIRAARKANKEEVKEAQRERRKSKMPKHLKKKRVKNGSGKK